MSKLLLGLSIIAYIALVGINRYRPTGTGDQMVGWGFVIFGVLAMYALCSLMLTINLVYLGKFNWVSDSAATRNIIVGFGYLCHIVGIVYITSINLEWEVETANWFGLIMVSYGATWMPLLMLVPYVLLLSANETKAILLSMYKIPLIMGCIIGLGFKFLSHEQLGALFRNKQAIANLKYETEMHYINAASNAGDLLYCVYKSSDERLTQAALTKLNTIENLDSALIGELNEYQVNGDYRWVIAYMENHKVQNAALFVEPLNKAIERLGDDLKYRIQGNNEEDFLKTLNIVALCKTLDEQFRPYAKDFRPNMMLIQAALEKDPLPVYLEIWNKYREAVKKYLDTH